MHSVSTLYFKIKLNRFLLSIRSHSTDNATYMFVYNPPPLCINLFLYDNLQIFRNCSCLRFCRISLTRSLHGIVPKFKFYVICYHIVASSLVQGLLIVH